MTHRDVKLTIFHDIWSKTKGPFTNNFKTYTLSTISKFFHSLLSIFEIEMQQKKN